jgi:hypothetical protein
MGTDYIGIPTRKKKRALRLVLVGAHCVSTRIPDRDCGIPVLRFTNCPIHLLYTVLRVDDYRDLAFHQHLDYRAASVWDCAHRLE